MSNQGWVWVTLICALLALLVVLANANTWLVDSSERTARPSLVARSAGVTAAPA